MTSKGGGCSSSHVSGIGTRDLTLLRGDKDSRIRRTHLKQHKISQL